MLTLLSLKAAIAQQSEVIVHLHLRVHVFRVEGFEALDVGLPAGLVGAGCGVPISTESPSDEETGSEATVKLGEG